MRLKGRGIPGKQAGDMFVVLRVVLPPADTEEAKAIYQRMADELGFDPRSELGV
jgi:curved DNA-binding protein